MRNPFARMTVLGAFALALGACSGGNGTSLPFAGPPNNAGGSQGTIQTGSNGSALLRFVQGSPDIGKVDVCVDQTSAGGAGSTNIAYKGFTQPVAIAGGIPHTVAVYVTPTGVFGGAGAACATAPGPYIGSSALAVTTITAGVQTRVFLVLGGRVGTTLGLYYFPNPTSFTITPTASEALGFDASPTFGKVGLGYNSVGGAAANLFPSLNAAVKSGPTATVTTAGSFGAAALTSPPASFFVGLPVSAGSVVPLTTEPATSPAAGSVYVADLVSVDSTNASGVDVVVISEPTLGYSF